MIEKFAEKIPDDLQHCSGSVFYSGRSAFSGQRDLYILGLNPGGNPSEQSSDTIGAHTQMVLSNKPDRWSEYSCESWKNKKPGQGGIQTQIIHLIKQLGYDTLDIPASNAVFVRSVDQDDLSQNWSVNDLAEHCWPFHQEVISQVNPLLIVAMGGKVKNILQQRLRLHPKPIKEVKQGSSFLVRIFENDRACKLAVVRHPAARAAKWTSACADPSGIVRQALYKAKVDGRRWSACDLH